MPRARWATVITSAITRMLSRLGSRCDEILSTPLLEQRRSCIKAASQRRGLGSGFSNASEAPGYKQIENRVFVKPCEGNQLISRKSKCYRYTISQPISEQFQSLAELFGGGAQSLAHARPMGAHGALLPICDGCWQLRR